MLLRSVFRRKPHFAAKYRLRRYVASIGGLTSFDLTNGLVAYFPLSDNASNTMVLNSFGVHGTYGAGVNTSTKHVSGPSSVLASGLDFDGNYIETEVGAIMQTLTDFTWLFWAYLDADGRHDLIVWQSATADDSLVLYATESAGDMRLNLYSASEGNIHGNPQSNSDISSAAWHLLGISKSGTNWTFWKDGGADGTANFAETLSNWTTNKLWLGSNHSNFVPNGFDTDGKLSQFVVFNRALSPEEVSYIWNLGEGRTFAVYSLPAGYGTYSLTGQAVGLNYNRPIVAGQGSYSLTGQAAGLQFNRSITAGSGSYSLTGQSVGLSRNYTLVGSDGSFSLTGQAVSLFYNKAITAGQGSYSLTGQASGLLYHRFLPVANGSFSLVGQSVGLSRNYTITSGNGSFSLTGQNTNLLYHRLLSANYGSFSLNGQSASLIYSRRLAADFGSFILSGQEADLRVESANTLSAGMGLFSMNGQAINLIYDRVLNAAYGLFNLDGQAATLFVTPVGGGVVDLKIYLLSAGMVCDV
jgi:hypothetical protein